MLLFAVTTCITLCCCLLSHPVSVMLLFAVTTCALWGSETWLTAFLNQLKMLCQIFVAVCCYSLCNSVLLFAVTACKLYVVVCCYSLYNSVLLFTVTACKLCVAVCCYSLYNSMLLFAVTSCICNVVVCCYNLYNSMLLFAVTSCICNVAVCCYNLCPVRVGDLADGLPGPAEDALSELCCCLLLQRV